MEIRRSRAASSVRTEGGLLPSDLLAKIAGVEPDVPGLTDVEFGLAAGERFREAITRSWNRLVGAWAALEAVRVDAEPTDPLTGPTRERFLLPLMEELGFGRLPVARAVEIEGTTYPISHNWQDRVPVHLVGFGVELDTRTKGVRGAAGAAPHALVQEYLNRADAAIWGLVANGRTLRLLRDSTSLTRQAYVEFDLEAIFTGELYADFALLWSVCHRTRFEGERPADCLLERWTKKAADDGTRALDKLRGGVEKSIETLGAGFLAHPANGELREALRTGALDRQDYYRELLRLVYRLIFLFTAEDRRDETTGRELLLDPAAPDDAVERYRRYYSTVRLRSFAGRRRGTRHPDLWVSLRRVMGALGSDGAPTLALPALGSFLFGSEACPHLDGADLRNEDLLDAVRALATIEEDRRLRLVDYRNLGAEELGGIYEGLLELHPQVEIDANPPRFSLGTAAGNERKSTGSYYTPTSLISCLLDSALDPVVDEAVKGKRGPDAEAAILGVFVVDPAAGSGHFIIAAAHRLAKRLASIRSGEGEPPPADVRHALRDVIAHCIYAVDINPMAVELCKVSLWLEALEPGRPLSFLDAHIRTGNSLLGTTPELAASGIPDSAFEPIAGDEKPLAVAWRKRNAQERSGQQALFEAPLTIPMRALAAATRELDDLPENTPEAVAAKETVYADYLASPDLTRSRATLDAWCSAFVAFKLNNAPEITTATVRAMAADPSRVPAAVRATVEALAEDYSFFHWQLEFPAVFERGGFHVVLGNPPWDRVKLDEREFFAVRAPAIARESSALKRKAMIAGLETSNPSVWREYRAALRRSEAQSHLLSDSGLFPLAAKGDLNTYAIFAERMVQAVAPTGRLGAVLPTGIATDDSTKSYFAHLIDRGSLVSLLDFENRLLLFASVDSRMKFCLLTATGGGPRATHVDLFFFAHRVEDLGDSSRRIELDARDFALLNPNTKTCPVFRSRRDAELVKGIYRRVPVLVNEAAGSTGNPWGIRITRAFDMGKPGSLQLCIPDRPDRDRQAYIEDGLVPMYEGKMIDGFDHRLADVVTVESAHRTGRTSPLSDLDKKDPNRLARPRFWIAADRPVGYRPAGWEYHLGYMDVGSSTNIRTMIPAVMPSCGTDYSIRIIADVRQAIERVTCLMANFGSFAYDYVIRQFIGGNHLSDFIVEQVATIPPDPYSRKSAWSKDRLDEWLVRRVCELVFTARDLEPFARDLGWEGPPFRWDVDRRFLIRAELDAAFLHLYLPATTDGDWLQALAGTGSVRDESDEELSGLRELFRTPREAAEHILDSFPIVRRKDEEIYGEFRTKRVILEMYDAMQEAMHTGIGYGARLDLPPGDPRAAHPPRPGEQPGHWVPWSEVLARAPQSAPATRSVRAAASPATQPTPAGQVPAIPEPAPSLFAGDPASAWQPEAAVAPTEVMMGSRVRHRAKGEGTVLSVRPSGKTTELLIRFDDTGEAWIVFGYGVLEFQQ